MRWIPFAMAFMFAAAAVLAVLAGARAHAARDPIEVTWDGQRYAIEARTCGDALCFDVVRGGRVAQTLAGSTDTLCDPPYALWLDGSLVVYDCGRYRAISRGDGAWHQETVDRLDGWWARQVLDSGTRLFAVGAVLVLLTLVALAAAGAALPAGKHG